MIDAFVELMLEIEDSTDRVGKLIRRLLDLQRERELRVVIGLGRAHTRVGPNDGDLIVWLPVEPLAVWVSRRWPRMSCE